MNTAIIGTIVRWIGVGLSMFLAGATWITSADITAFCESLVTVISAIGSFAMLAWGIWQKYAAAKKLKEAAK